MTLTQLRYVLAVADTHSMNEAARTLFIAQPSLSQAVKELAGELGLRPNALTKRLLRLRESLRRSLEREGVSV